MLLNTIYNEDCFETFKRIDDKSIDMVLTSPPYDNLRTYNGYSWDFENTARELFRILKDGGVVVWVVGDATINGSETGTSFKQALYFKEIGFNLHDTMIWVKNQMAYPSKNRYYGAFEFMFILSKSRPKTFNPIKDKRNISEGRKWTGTQRKPNGETEQHTNKDYVCGERGIRLNYWLIYNQSRGIHSGHPATFPLQLAIDHIISWSNEGDVVLDPFIGSGTTAMACVSLNRQYIGCELSKEYHDIAIRRVDAAKHNL